MRIAVDIGGTYTDLVISDAEKGTLSYEKVLTTPEDFAEGVVDAIGQSGVDTKRVIDFVHGTTVIINAVVERKGARVALLTTRGFEDILDIGRAQRAKLYDLLYVKPEPFVPRELRLGVHERMNYKGQPLVPLSDEEIEKVVQWISQVDPEAVAICLLHSYANPLHEDRLEMAISRAMPDRPVCASNKVTRDWREYERSNTTVLNSYVQPVAEYYLASLEARLRSLGIGCILRVMKSNGGTSTFAISKTAAIQMIESGPVAGVIGAQLLGNAMGLDNVISLDVGGTTAKTSLIEGNKLTITQEYRVGGSRELGSGYPVSVPVVDIKEIGAGGGSIAWIDAGGALRVGPQSAGAMPGPACYDRGGTQPTLTDAHLVAGRIDPDYYLGGKQALVYQNSVAALDPIAKRFAIPVEEAALGVIRLAGVSMLRAVKLISVNRGRDPREFALLAFGGAGPMHAPTLARDMGIKQVIIPPMPGVFSAWGMQMADLRFDCIQTRVGRIDKISGQEVDEVLDQLERTIIEGFEEESLPGSLVFSHFSDLRYVGQEHSVRVPIARPPRLKVIEEAFHKAHEQLYTFRLGSKVEFVNFYVSGESRVEKPRLEMLRSVKQAGRQMIKGTRTVGYEDYGWLESNIYERSLLSAGQCVEGPAIIEEVTSTIVLAPEQSATVDRFGNIVIDTGV